MVGFLLFTWLPRFVHIVCEVFFHHVIAMGCLHIVYGVSSLYVVTKVYSRCLKGLFLVLFPRFVHIVCKVCFLHVKVYFLCVVTRVYVWFKKRRLHINI